MEELDGIDPDDIAELEARARKIVEDASTYYEISFLVPHDGAQEFLSKYDQAESGDIMAIFSMMSLIHAIARSIYMAMEMSDEEDQ
jgi:short-subunit dehydrogenase